MWYVHTHPTLRVVEGDPSPHGPYATQAEAIEMYHRLKRQSEPLLTIKMVKQLKRHPQ